MHGASSRGKRDLAAVRPSRAAALERLEPRQLMSVSYPTAAEQYLLELVSRARANPAAEAARYGITLNEGLKPGTLSAAAKQPLAFNPNLTAGAQRHTAWMLASDRYGHDEAGAGPVEQMRGAGFPFTGTWWGGQNVWWYGYTPPKQPPLNPTIDLIHKGLFVDAGITGRTHRLNILKASLKEVGVGIGTGVHREGGRTYDDVLATEDFAVRNLGSGGGFLTGVAYRDGDGNRFYTPGEGLGGVTVTATRTRDKKIFRSNTWDAGGYSLKVPAGTYRVTASGGAFAAPTAVVLVKVRSTNVKVDFDPTGGATVATPGATASPAVRSRTARLTASPSNRGHAAARTRGINPGGFVSVGPLALIGSAR